MNRKDIYEKKLLNDYNEMNKLIDYYVEMNDYVQYISEKKKRLEKVIIRLLYLQNKNKHTTKNVCIYLNNQYTNKSKILIKKIRE